MVRENLYTAKQIYYLWKARRKETELGRDYLNTDSYLTSSWPNQWFRAKISYKTSLALAGIAGSRTLTLLKSLAGGCLERVRPQILQQTLG